MTNNPADNGSKKILYTPLCELLRIRYPIIQAGMAGGITTPELVASVSNAGALGVLGASRLTPEQTRDQIRRIKALTNQPFGVNLVIAPPEPNVQELQKVQKIFDQFRQELGIPLREGAGEVALPSSRISEQLGVVFEEKVSVLSIGLGDSARFVSEAHQIGAKVIAMITTVDEARKVADGGADIIIAQGSEAGGHRSTFALDQNGDAHLVGTIALIPQIVDAVMVPVVAAGGIMDGRGIAAAMALGAQGASLGTRFLVAKESGAFQAYKQRLLQATEADTLVTKAFTGRPARSIRNRFITEFEKAGIRPLAWPLQGIVADDIYKEAELKNNADYFPILAGQGLRILREEQQTAAKIVEQLVRQTVQVIETSARLVQNVHTS
ncbi:MAG TPA: nitronate monooxygenase [Nitrososphaeraceae archaeon]|nr:nitronate monooxygenase [Nitrososphaeraceae archaeon]